MYVDSHCHLSFPELSSDIDGVVERMAAAGVTAALNVCVTLEEFPRVLALAKRFPNIFCSVGVHPDYPAGGAQEGAPLQEPDVDALLQLAAEPKVVAIGETGLDYYRLKEPLDWQRERFRTHIRAARRCGKPLIVHTRAAAADTLRLMREEGAGDAGGVMHCFTETWDVARAALDQGFYISFSGIVTFKSATELQEVAAKVPLDRLLIETDSPYLAPVPYRGKPNEPGYVPHVAAKIASLRGVSREEIAHASRSNFFNLFRIL
jgi:TatD DNase family protein